MKLSVAISLLWFAVSCQVLVADSRDVASQTDPKESAILEQGKKIFVARCAKCHDADANKALPDGTTLLKRLAQSKDPEARLGTRLKDPQERHAVMIYVDSLLKSLHSPSEK